MIRMILCLAGILFSTLIYSQHTIRFSIKAKESGEPLAGASVLILSQKKGATADSTGHIEFKELAAGKYRFRFSYTGMEERDEAIQLPYEGKQPIEVLLETEGEEEEEVIIQSTRTSRNIINVPTRVETIAMEEIDEKSNMRPGNVSMLLHESTGIQVQQTSATSGNASIRIQGLDGRYTQLLKDGFASFGNFASGLSVLEIPPLDLKQVEIIKGPASTLYGGGAIAGVVNFISKTPGTEAQHNILLNQSNIGQSNISYYSSKRGNKLGYTFLGLYTRQQLFDVDKDDFTEVPESSEFTLHPRFFFYPSDKSTFIIGNSFTKGEREGGDVQVVKGKPDIFHRFFEQNNTIRNITTLEWQKKIRENRNLTIKQSLSVFDRHIRIPDYHFHGISYNSFTDASYLINRTNHSIVTGANILYDYFDEKKISVGNRDNRNISGGAYIQDTWDASEKIKLESGLRFDWAQYSNAMFSSNEFFALPRISLLVKYNDKLSSRIGAGLGYKLPTLFTERTETIQYQGVQQLDDVKSERSYGSTADLNFRTRIGNDLDLSFNHMFFYTWINRPLVLEDNGGGTTRFVNADQPVQSMGFETNTKFIFKHDFKLFLGYTFTDAKAKYLTGNQFLPLVPKHKFNSALIYEKHEFLKLGLEAYYTSPQYLYNGFRTEDFWEWGFMAEKLFERFSVYINFENFTDTRQSKFKRVANDPHDNPSFDDIWTHTEGFVINGGVKIRF